LSNSERIGTMTLLFSLALQSVNNPSPSISPSHLPGSYDASLDPSPLILIRLSSKPPIRLSTSRSPERVTWVRLWPILSPRVIVWLVCLASMLSPALVYRNFLAVLTQRRSVSSPSVYMVVCCRRSSAGNYCTLPSTPPADRICVAVFRARTAGW
jgi:hypothetical protein